MTYHEDLDKFKARRQQILDIYEAGVGVTVIARELDITRARVYQLLKRARREKEAELVQEKTVEVNE